MIRENFVFLSFRKLYGYLHVERRNVFFESVAVAKLLYMWTGSDTFKKSTLYILIFNFFGIFLGFFPPKRDLK